MLYYKSKTFILCSSVFFSSFFFNLKLCLFSQWATNLKISKKIKIKHHLDFSQEIIWDGRCHEERSDNEKIPKYIYSTETVTEDLGKFQFRRHLDFRQSKSLRSNKNHQKNTKCKFWIAGNHYKATHNYSPFKKLGIIKIKENQPLTIIHKSGAILNFDKTECLKRKKSP